MPFPFTPSTTSHLTFQSNFISTTHPSLPSAATSQRNVLRSALKAYKRLSAADQADGLSNLLTCLADYLKYLTTIDIAISGKPVSNEEIDLALTREIEVEWRSTLSSSSVPGREADRIKGRGPDYEIFFVHHTYAVIKVLQARQSLQGLYAKINPTPEQRVALIQTATKSMRTAYALHAYLTQLSSHSPDGPPAFPPNATDILPSVQSSLQRITAAEVNLLGVLKDDPYPGLLVQSRNESDKEWMIKAPEIPQMRTQILTRLCIGAADHAAAALASLKAEGKKVSKELIDYTDDLRHTARAKACRFQALASDLAGETGKAIAWIHAAFNELGIEINTKDGSSRVSRLDRLRSSWHERREDKRIAKADPRWGIDGGKAEEVRIVEYLDRKFNKENSTINIQVVPEWRPLLAMLPSGMTLPVEDKWKGPVLAENELSSMRAPPEEERDPVMLSSGDEDDGNRGAGTAIAGTFPGTRGDYQPSPSYY